ADMSSTSSGSDQLLPGPPDPAGGAEPRPSAWITRSMSGTIPSPLAIVRPKFGALFAIQLFTTDVTSQLRHGPLPAIVVDAAASVSIGGLESQVTVDCCHGPSLR